MRLRRPTVIHRAVVDTVGAVIVSPETDAPRVDLVRNLIVLVPNDPAVALQLDVKPEDIALSRPYLWPEPPTGGKFNFCVMAHQFLSGIVQSEGNAHLTVIIEYLE